MDNALKKLFLLDGMVLIFRSHFAFTRNPRVTAKGRNVSIPYGFTSTLIRILEKENPTHIAVVFDTTGPTKRHEIFPAYKGQRDKAPEELDTAIPDVDRILDAFNIPAYRLSGFEADDLIGTIAKRADREGFETYIVTTDKDFAQLVTDNTYLYRLSTRNDTEEIMGISQIQEKWDVQRVDQVIDILSLWGDTSDNIPGVTGIGEKTAQKLLAQFDTVENLLQSTDQLKGKQRENLENEAEIALLSKQLATIDRNVPLDFNLEDMRRQSPNMENLKQIFIELEFSQLGKRVFGDLFAKQQDASKSEFLQTIDDIETNYQLVETAEQRLNLIQLLSQQSAFCFDCETTSLDKKQAELVGLAFSFAPQTGFYVPFPTDSDWFYLKAGIGALSANLSLEDKVQFPVANWQQQVVRECFPVGNELIIEASHEVEGQKQFRLNGDLLSKLSEWVGQFRVVLFSPESLILVKGAPGDRRRFLDQLICQINPLYLSQLQRYQSSLRQRNELLKQIRNHRQSVDLLEPWDELLVEDGILITKVRTQMLDLLHQSAKNHHAQLTQSTEVLNLRYCPSLQEVETTDNSEKEVAVNHFRQRLQKSRSTDLIYGNTSVGPHRDEFKLFIQEPDSNSIQREVKLYGSQGQQRTTSLALKLGEVELIHSQTGNVPVVLLDDVLSELDDIRSQLLFALFQDFGAQLFITATREEEWVAHLPTNFNQHYRLITIDNGQIVA
ncbi:hypothetical protein CMK12_00535 [Candidatus Poribacteria bacterium]|nr:hypothetical protein [Candidatus Poribacteria bacterium]